MTNEELFKVKTVGWPPGLTPSEVALFLLGRLDSENPSMKEFQADMRWLMSNISNEEKSAMYRDKKVQKATKKHQRIILGSAVEGSPQRKYLDFLDKLERDKKASS